jgi:hypothetical protein
MTVWVLRARRGPPACRIDAGMGAKDGDDTDDGALESTDSTLGRVQLRQVRTTRAELDETLGRTMTEAGTTSTRLHQPIGALLVHIGSPENGFVGAGHAFSIAETSRVRFGRAAAGPRLSVERTEHELTLGIPLAWVSGRHAELSVVALDARAFSFQLVDLESRNGTTLEGRRVSRAVKLFPGQAFEIGRSFWMVREVHGRLDAQPGPIDPTGTVHPELRQMHRTLERLAPSDLPILLVGETGSGKDYHARAVHRTSGRTGPFVTVNVAATGLEPLAGPEGVLARARAGTIYLDEVTALAPEDQARLLQAMDDAAPAGGEAPGPRWIASSSRDVRIAVDGGKFRPDLYARLSVFEGRLPALRERREDMGLLLRAICRTRDGRPAAVTTSAFRRLLAHRWPFNVRELGQTLQAALAVGERDDTVTLGGLDEVLRHVEDVPAHPSRIADVRERLLSQLVAHRGDTEQVARSLSCDASELQRWLRRFELDPGAYAGGGPISRA